MVALRRKGVALRGEVVPLVPLLDLLCKHQKINITNVGCLGVLAWRGEAFPLCHLYHIFYGTTFIMTYNIIIYMYNALHHLALCWISNVPPSIMTYNIHTTYIHAKCPPPPRTVLTVHHNIFHTLL